MPRPPAGPAAAAQAQLAEVLEPVVARAGYDLESVGVTSAGRRSMVRVVVDADGGIDLDAVATVSRLVSETLDEAGGDGAGPRLLDGPYVLEVTSPGVDRPLTEPRHWRRARGRLVRVDVAGCPVLGRVESVDDAGVTLRLDGGAVQPVAWAELGQGKVQVEFNRPDGAGSGADGGEEG